MNKKKDIIALALSVSFVMGGASLSHADEINSDTTSYISEKQPSESEPSVQKPGNDDKNITEVNDDSDIKEENLLLSEEKTPQAVKAGEASGEETTSDSQPKAPKPLSEEEVAKLEAEAKRVSPGAESVVVDPTTGWITVKTKVKVKEGDKEVEKEKTETINPYTPAGDEKLIKDYSESERYKETDLQPGDTNQDFNKTDEKVEKDGFKFELKNPSDTSPSKTEYGYKITIDKKTGQRTYTKVTVTDSGLISVDPGNKPMMDQGDKITPESPAVTYKPNEDTNLTASRRQRNLNYEASKETLEHINNKDNDSTSFGMKDDYTQDNPRPQFFGGNFGISYKVNPWPNENDKLELLKLNGSYNEKVFVQGQEIDTGIKVDNIDDNAKERLVGQVYNPVTGEIVPGASAYIGDDGNIHIQMPKGALKKSAEGKYVVDEESIFNTKDYKALQHLDVKFFARPRTKDEFTDIANTPDDFGGTGTYVETGAGSATINHNGTNITIDKQGIDRYDHYNLIGDFKLKLDDTRYYDQDFKDQEGNKIDEHTSTKVFPGQEFSVEIQDPKTGAEMDGAYSRGEASGKLKEEFLGIANKKIADDLGVDYDEFITSDDYADKRWTVDGKSDNISKFTIKAPKQAKAGDFLALPVEYTYTNGSIDTHWFHFVVQETNNNRPEYLAEVGPQGNVLVNNPIIPKNDQDLKKNQPKSYELIGNTFKDNKGNVWNVSIDQTTGAVTATLPLGKEINGGEKLTVPVKVKYTDQTTGEEKTEEINAQFIATKQHKTLTNETKTSEISYETEVLYDKNLPEGYFQETQAGQKGELKITFVQDTLNGKKGIFQQDGTFEEGESKIVVETVKEPTKRIITIGTKPASTTVEIPFDTEYEVDNNLEAGKTELINDGEKGEVTITTTRNEDGTITVNQNVTKEAVNKKIKIGTKTQGEIVDTDKIPFKYKVEFDPDFYTNYPDATENYKVVTPGKEGENTKTWTIVNSQKDGNPKIEITDPVDAVIKVGQKDYSGTVTNTVTKEVPYTVRVVKNPELEAGKSSVKQKGVAGSKTFEYSGEIFNGELKEGTQFIERELTEKNVDPVEEIIEIGTKPANNEQTYEREVGVEVEYVYDNTKEKGYRNIEDLVPGKVITKVVNEYNPETGEIETTEKIEVIPGKRKVTFGTKDFTGEYEEVDKNIIPYETEIVFDNTLKVGEKVIDQAGENGETVTKTKKHLVNGVVESSEDPVTEETKKVQNQIIRVGTMTDGKHSYTEKLPYKYEIDYDSSLKAGEYVIDVEGKEGSKTTEWTIKNSKVVEGSASVTEHTPATNAKIRVGKKDFTGNVSHEVTEEIPYDVKVIEDRNMIAGTSEVVTEGKAGSKTTKYTQGIKNGEVDGKLQSEVTAQTNPIQQVIKVGTKPAENKKDYAQDVDVKVEYVYDENLDKGVVQVGDLTKGKVETKIVNKYDPKTGEVTTTGEEIVKDATQKIIVGTKDFTGTYKYEKTCPLPFEVEIKEDPNLAKGEKIVDQEGVVGSKTTYYEQGIKNGNPDGDPKQLSEKINSQPKNHIVRIGTKVAESSTVKTVDREIPFETEYIYDDTMDAGSEKVENEGKVGKERVTITTKITDGTGEASEETKTITEKEDRKVRIGTKPVTKVVEKPFNTEYQYDENLEAGKTEEVTPGRNGKVTITTSYDKDQKKVVTSETEEAGQNRVVKIGGKTNGTEKVKEEIPFDVEVRKDPSLKKGEWKYATDDEGNELKGEKGEQEKTLTIVNSKVTETSEPTVIKKAKNAVVLVCEGVNDGTHTITEEVDVPFEIKIEFDDSLKPGEQKVIQEGEPGKNSRDITLTIQDGKVTNTKEGEFTQTKAPKDKIIKVGRNTEGKVEHKEEIPFGYKVEEVEDLKKGEYRIVKPGKVGTKTTTWTIENSKVVGELTEEIVPAEDALIQVGKGTNDGTHEIVEKKELPFETRYEYDDSLEPGEEKVVTPGSPGEQERTNTIVIKDGKVVEVKEGEFKTTKEPQERLIKIGRKSTEGEVTKTTERDIPFETKVIYDENLEAGSQVIEKEGKLGKEEVTITQKVKDSKPVGDPTETTKTITEKEDRVVIIGVKPVVKETEIGYDTEYRHNLELKAGEEKVIEEGSKGSVKYTTTFNKETGNLEVKEERTEPTNKVVEYGSKTKDEFTYESEQAFDTKIVEDSNLEAGKTVVDQEGVTGRTKTTVKIENSKKVSENTATIVEKQDKIVRVGTKSVCEIPPVKPTEGETTKTIEREIPYETKVIYDETLESGTQKIENEGKAGKEEVTITQKVKDSKPVGDPTETIKTIIEKEDRVVRIGVKPVVNETELGHDTEYRYNSELKEGEQKVVKEGSKGSVKYTTTFNKETGKLEVKEERVEPKNKVVEYGSKTDGEFTYESEKAYDIIIRENPDLEAGKTNLIQEGKPGKTETTVKIENSKEVSRDTKTITEKQDKIIEIGTKNVCEIPPVTPGEEDPKDPEKPGEENPKDPEKPGEEDPKDPEKPGEEDPKDPEKPGKEDPKDPEKPGEDDPKDPEKPGEDDSKDPEKPGEEDPKDPEKPGKEDPKDPEKPGEEDPKDPEEPGEEDPKDPEKPGEEDPKDPGKPGEKDPTKPGQTSETPQKHKDKKDKKINPSRKLEKTKIVSNKEDANKNPSTGVSSLSTVLSSLGLSLGALSFSKKKRKNK